MYHAHVATKPYEIHDMPYASYGKHNYITGGGQPHLQETFLMGRHEQTPFLTNRPWNTKKKTNRKPGHFPVSPYKK